MQTMRLFFVATLLLWSVGAKAQEGRFDPTFEIVRDNREAFTNVVFLFGDSITRGNALDIFPDQADQEMRSSALWPFRSPASMINLFLRASGVRQDLDGADNPTAGRFVATYAGGPVGPSPDKTRPTAETITELSAGGIIRPQDFIVLEDAGDHGNDPLAYQAAWKLVIAAAAETAASVIVLNTYDLGPEIGFANVDWRDYSFHTLYRLPDATTTTFNQSIDRAAFEVGKANVSVLDFDGSMRALAARTGAINSTGVTREGVHLNIVGQCALASLILRKTAILAEPRPQEFTNILKTAAYAEAPAAVTSYGYEEALVSACLKAPLIEAGTAVIN